jgi:hypothetical protein
MSGMLETEDDKFALEFLNSRSRQAAGTMPCERVRTASRFGSGPK